MWHFLKLAMIREASYTRASVFNVQMFKSSQVKLHLCIVLGTNQSVIAYEEINSNKRLSLGSFKSGQVKSSYIYDPGGQHTVLYKVKSLCTSAEPATSHATPTTALTTAHL